MGVTHAGTGAFRSAGRRHQDDGRQDSSDWRLQGDYFGSATRAPQPVTLSLEGGALQIAGQRGEQRLALGVPHLQGAVPRTRHEPRSAGEVFAPAGVPGVGREQRRRPGRSNRRGGRRHGRGRVPQPEAHVGGGGRQVPTVGMRRQSAHPEGVSGKGGQRRTGGGVPDFDGGVPGAGCGDPTPALQTDATLDAAGLPGGDNPGGAIGQIPDPKGLVGRRGGEIRAVWSERAAPHLSLVPLKPREPAARLP